VSVRRIRRATAKQWLTRQSFRLAEEIRSIQQHAAERDSCIVSIGPLVLFSTQTGDAWILDPSDRLAARLAQDGGPLPIYTEETDANYSIGWQGRFRIDAEVFIYEDDESRRQRSILGYPTRLLLRMIAQLERQ
jgi:hypothetical protein